MTCPKDSHAIILAKPPTVIPPVIDTVLFQDSAIFAPSMGQNNPQFSLDLSDNVIGLFFNLIATQSTVVSIAAPIAAAA